MDLQYATAISPVTVTAASAEATVATNTTVAANAATATTAATGSSTDNLGAFTAELTAGSTWVAARAVVVYLIISQTAAHIEVYRRATNWKREDYLGLEAVIELPQPVLTISLAVIYAKVLASGLLGLEKPA